MNTSLAQYHAKLDYWLVGETQAATRRRAFAPAIKLKCDDSVPLSEHVRVVVAAMRSHVTWAESAYSVPPGECLAFAWKCAPGDQYFARATPGLDFSK